MLVSISHIYIYLAGSLVRELGLSAGGHGCNLPSRPASEILEVSTVVTSGKNE